MTVKLLKSVYWRLVKYRKQLVNFLLRLYWRQSFIQFHSIKLLKKEIIPESNNLSQDIRLEEMTDQHAIQKTYESVGSDITDELILARLKSGLKFYALVNSQDQAIASSWIIPGPKRYVDIIALEISLDVHSIWERDLFVAKHSRGKGLYQIMMTEIFRKYYPDVRAVCSSVQRQNKVSMRAHEKFGFQVVDEYMVLRLVGKVLIRLKKPDSQHVSGGYKENRSLVYMGSAFKAYDKKTLM